jgi:hypothetical protein
MLGYGLNSILKQEIKGLEGIIENLNKVMQNNIDQKDSSVKVLMNGEVMEFSMSEVQSELSSLISRYISVQEDTASNEETPSNEENAEATQKYDHLKKKIKSSKHSTFQSILSKKYSEATHINQYHFDLKDNINAKYALDLFNNSYMFILLRSGSKILIDAILPVLPRPYSPKLAITKEPYLKVKEELTNDFKVDQLSRIIQFNWKYSIRLSQCDFLLEDFGFDLVNCPLEIALNYRQKAYGLGIVLGKTFLVLFAPFKFEDYLRINTMNNYNKKINKKRVFLVFHNSGHDGYFFQNRQINNRFGIVKPPKTEIAKENSKWEQRNIEEHLRRRKQEIMGRDNQPVRIQDAKVEHFDVKKSAAFGLIHSQKDQDYEQLKEYWESICRYYIVAN